MFKHSVIWEYRYELVTGLFILFLFISTFNLLGNQSVYNATLGKISSNYVKENNEITNKQVAFVQISNDKFNYWDAGFYNYIKENFYKEHPLYGNGIYAFFPLFPLISRILHINQIQECLLNYLLFLSSLLMLASVFWKNIPVRIRCLSIALLLVLPVSLAFYIPYSEGVFNFFFVAAFIASVKENKYGYFLFMLLFAMSRPVISIILICYFIYHLMVLISRERVKFKLQSALLDILPIITGTTLALAIQSSFSKDFLLFFKVQQSWGHHFRLPSVVSDWSHESFGLNAFALFAFSLPVLLITLIDIYKILFRNNSPGTDIISKTIFISKLYICGILLFVIFFQGGSLNGLHRYTLASPFALILIIHCLSLIYNKLISIKKISICVLIFFTASILFLLNSGYHNEYSFANSGFSLGLISFLYLIILFRSRLHITFILAPFLILANIVWLNYLFNMFLSDAWIVT